MAKSREFGLIESNHTKEGIGNSYRPMNQQQQLLTPNVFLASDDESSFAFVLEDVSKPSAAKNHDKSFVEFSRLDRQTTTSLTNVEDSKLPSPMKYHTELSFEIASSPETLQCYPPSQPEQRKLPRNSNLIDLGSPPNSPFNQQQSGKEQNNHHTQAFHYNVPGKQSCIKRYFINNNIQNKKIAFLPFIV